jgi:hypothetical protein
MTFSDSTRALKPLNFEISTNLLEQIGVNMYSRYQKAIGELVVNGYDADANFVQVRIDQAHDFIEIDDNGSGMDEDGIRNQFMFLGTRQKRAIPRTPVFHRLPIGQKGIGKLAGFGIARCIEMTTVKSGVQYEFRLDRDELENSERRGKLNEAVLNRSLIQLRERRAPAATSGTVVRLTKLRPECGHIDVDKVIAHLALELPQDSTFRVVVNARECKRQDVPASKRYSIDVVDPVCGPIKGEVVVAKKRLPDPGVLVSVRGRVVGRPNWFGVNREAWRFTIAPLITGCVEVPGFDPEDLTGEAEVIKTDREGFVETHPKYVALAAYMKARLEEIYRELVQQYEQKEEEEKRSKVSEAIRQVASDLNEWERDRVRRLTEAGSMRGRQDEAGQRMQHGVVAVNGRGGKGAEGPKPGIPPAIMEEIRAILGVGRLRFAGRSLEVKTAHLGEDFAECDVRWEESLVLVNLDHPAYDQAVANRCVEIVTFRAVAAALALEECTSAAEMYTELDSMVRFHAARMGQRARKRHTEAPDEDEMLERSPT